MKFLFKINSKIGVKNIKVKMSFEWTIPTHLEYIYLSHLSRNPFKMKKLMNPPIIREIIDVINKNFLHRECSVLNSEYNNPSVIVIPPTTITPYMCKNRKRNFFQKVY